MSRITLINGRVLTPNLDIDPGQVVVADGKIESVGPVGPSTQGNVVDCSGHWILPGLVDIHCHGGGGGDFLDEDDALIEKAFQYHLSEGVTSVAPTFISIDEPHLIRSLRRAHTWMERAAPSVIGVHVEGPYLCMTYRGGHKPEYIREADKKEYDEILNVGGDIIALMTVAPEVRGVLDLIAECRAKGIVTSAGHSDCDYATLMQAIDAGLTHTTHYACVMGNLRFEALRHLHAKGFATGLLENILANDYLTTEILVDGYHINQGFVDLVMKNKGPEGACLVSDAMRATGLADGEYTFGDQVTVMKDGISYLKDRPEIITSPVTPLRLMMRSMVEQFGYSMRTAAMMATLTPAKILGCDDRKGSIAPGKDADLLVMDVNWNVHSVYVGGELAPTP